MRASDRQRVLRALGRVSQLAERVGPDRPLEERAWLTNVVELLAVLLKQGQQLPPAPSQRELRGRRTLEGFRPDDRWQVGCYET